MADRLERDEGRGHATSPHGRWEHRGQATCAVENHRTAVADGRKPAFRRRSPGGRAPTWPGERRALPRRPADVRHEGWWSPPGSRPTFLVGVSRTPHTATDSSTSSRGTAETSTPSD